VIPVPDCRIIGNHVDGFLLVVTAHKTPAKLFDETVRVLDSAKVLGVVFNGGDMPETSDYYGGYPATGPYQGTTAGTRPWKRRARPSSGGVAEWTQRQDKPTHGALNAGDFEKLDRTSSDTASRS
jgi:hypothetical protein